MHRSATSEPTDLRVAVGLERREPRAGHGSAPDAGPVPDVVEFAPAREILRDAGGVLQIDHGVPPAAGHKNGLSRLLDALDAACLRVRGADLGRMSAK